MYVYSRNKGNIYRGEAPDGRSGLTLMLFYTTSTFRLTFATLMKKSKDGYSSVGKDICNAR